MCYHTCTPHTTHSLKKNPFWPSHPAPSQGPPRKMSPDASVKEEPSRAERVSRRVPPTDGTQLPHIISAHLIHHLEWHRFQAGRCSVGAPLALVSASWKGPQIVECPALAPSAKPQC